MNTSKDAEAIDQDRRCLLGVATVGIAVASAATLLPSQMAASPAVNAIRPFRVQSGTMATAYDLVCPFLTDDPVFAYGVEFGLLYARVQSGEDEICDYFCRENQDRILLLASRLLRRRGAERLLARA